MKEGKIAIENKRQCVITNLAINTLLLIKICALALCLTQWAESQYRLQKGT